MAKARSGASAKLVAIVKVLYVLRT